MYNRNEAEVQDESEKIADVEPDEEIFAVVPDENPEPYPTERGKEREVFTTPIDPDVQTILSQLIDRTLILKPDFQRMSVWDRTRQSRLIESLVVNIPIPPCFFAEEEDGTRIVVDGQQRLRAIEEFHSGQYKLRGLDVRADLNGAKWVDLDPADARRILRRVLRTIVISHFSDPDIKFEIFKRLNTGGLPLTEQEIRNAIHRGSLNRLLDELAYNKSFLGILRRDEPDKRLRHHELILRFFALQDGLGDFKPPLKRLLNDYMEGQRHASEDQINGLRRQFEDALSNTVAIFHGNAFRRFSQGENGDTSYEAVISKAVFDLQMIGIGDLREQEIHQQGDAIRQAFEALSLEDENFQDFLSRATDHRKRFYGRMKLWADKLDDLGLRAPFAERIPPETDW